ncbi:MAG: hypothetical protein ACRDCT_21330 [Shewanella sp.]
MTASHLKSSPTTATKTKTLTAKQVDKAIELLAQGELKKASLLLSENRLPQLTEAQAEQLKGITVLSEPMFEDYFINPFSVEGVYGVDGAGESTSPLELVSDYMTALIGASRYDFDTRTNHIDFILEAMEQAKPTLIKLEQDRQEYNAKQFVLVDNQQLVSQINGAKAARIHELEMMGDMELMRLEIRLEMTGANPEQLNEVKQVIEARIAATKKPTLTEPMGYFRKETHHGDDIARESASTGGTVNYSGDKLPVTRFNNREMVVPIIGEEIA